ncbi:MAG TPA: TolC family protein [Chitinophagales bacterium]|nr:TolC family protein [Chitinophagales bacterium]
MANVFLLQSFINPKQEPSKSKLKMLFYLHRAKIYKKLLRSFLFLSLILTATLSFAQKTWTLEECISYAKENNISVKKAQLTQQLSEYSVLQSKMNFFPSVNASTGYYFNYGKTIDPTSNLFVTQNTQTNTLSLSASVGLFNGLQRWNTLKQSQFDLLASQANTENTVNNVLLFVVGGFLNIVYAKENLQITQDQLQLAQDQLGRTKKLVDAGALTQGSQYDIEAQEALSEVAKVTAQNNLDIAKLNLAQLLNLNEPVDVAVAPINMTTELSQMNQTMEGIYSIALTTQPSIRGADYQLKSAQKGVDIARGRLYPSLSMFGSLTTNYSNLYKNYSLDSSDITTFPIGFLSTDLTPVYTTQFGFITNDVPLGRQYNDNFGQAFGFSLDIPIFNNWQNRNNVSRSKINVLDAQYNLESAKQQLLKDVQSAYADAVAAKNSYEASLKAVTSLQKSFDDAQKKFDVGLITSLDFTTIKTNFNKAQSDLLQAKYQYIFKLKVLDFYQGKPITL